MANSSKNGGGAGSSVDGDMKIPAEIARLQDQLLQQPLALDLRLEAVQLEDAAESQEDHASFSHDQRLHIWGNFSTHLCALLDLELNAKQKEKTQIILVVDRSGSMAGNPFNQVKTAMQEIVSQCLQDENKYIDIITYADTAEMVTFTAFTFKENITALKAAGMTNFKSAFDQVEAIMTGRQNEAITETIILFMTDGRDTVSTQSKVNEYSKKWARTIKQIQQHVTVHAVGFSKDHDLDFLTRISKAGTSAGMYRYCEPGDGPQALKNKLEELFDYVSISGGRPVQFEICLANKNDKITAIGSHTGVIEGVIDSTEKEDKTTELFVSCECWIYVQDTTSLPQSSVGISMVITKNHVKYTLQIPCQINKLDRVVIVNVSDKVLWNLALLSRNTDMMTSQLLDTITAGGDVMKWKCQIDQLQLNLSSTEIFKSGFDKNTRTQIMDFVKDIQNKIDKLHAMVAQYLRGEAHSVSLLARAQDLRYDAQFSKSRRQRLMDRRVAQNFGVVKYQAAQATVSTEDDLAQLSDEALEFYYCILSMSTVKDILVDESDLENAIGLGLAVARPEHVLDDPTSIRVFSISGSLVSRSSIMDALKYKMNISSPLSAHGGFSFDGTWSSEVSYATVGAGREPINAWLPLYICPAHWQRVKSCLRPSLGYLCTLDPLGYSDSQLDVMFMVLGRMIGQLWETEVGENQIRLIFALQRTCQACIQEFNMETKVTEVVKNFLASPMGRLRHVMPNLFTLIGYMASLPVSVLRCLIGCTDCDRKDDHDCPHLNKLWVGYITEMMRRASANKPHLHKTENVIISLLNMLLHGRQGSDHTEMSASTADPETLVHFSQLVWTMLEKHLDVSLDIPEYDPSKEVEKPEVKTQQSAKVDKAMEVWAQAQCGVITNKSRSEQVTNAKKVVKKWVAMVREKVGMPSEETAKKLVETVAAEAVGPGKVVEVPACGGATAGAERTERNPTRDEARQKATQFDTRAVNSSIIEITAKVLAQLSGSCYPPLSSLPGCVGFFHYLVKNDLNIEEITTNGGLPPQHWIDGVKASVTQVFMKLAEGRYTEENNACHDGPGDGDDDNDRLHGEGGLPQKDNQLAGDDVDGYAGDEEEEVVDSFMRRSHRAQIERLLTLPMLLNALGIEGDHIQLVRAMLCQAVSYPSNSQARDAITSGELTDLTSTGTFDDNIYSVPGGAHGYLCSVEAKLVERKDTALKKMVEKAAWEIGNMCMLRAESVWAFIGYLMTTHKERGEGFSALINFILECPGVQGFPLLAEKIQVLLSGKHKGTVVFAKGNSWIPDKKVSKSLEKILGEEVWQNIETELLSQVHIHVYRESDIPNRHGHCNSNPYIPNRIRQVLNMPLIDEKIQPRTSIKKNRSLQNKK